MKNSVTFLVILALGCGGCSSYLTKSGRQQAAYARYVKKQSHGRVKLQKLYTKSRQRPIKTEPSEPVTTTSTGPESVSASGSQ